MASNVTGSRRLAAPERRRLIEDAATQLFAERGYLATTIDDIVAGAGVTKPMLYRHFESKQDLVMTLLERHRDELAAAPLDALLASADRPFAERLDAMLEEWFGYVEAHPFVRLLLHDSTGDSEVAALVEELHDRQRAADVALLREFVPHVPEHELVPLGEIIRSSLAALGLWRLDHPDTDAASVNAALRRVILAVVESSQDETPAPGTVAQR
jgi:AcrR family transcriptional regulator